MFTEQDLSVIDKGLNVSKMKNDEIKLMLMGMSDPEVDEIDNVISDIKEKLKAGNVDFSEREAEEIKTGLMGLLSQDINNKEVQTVLGKIREKFEL